jgi:hypothetical protein
VPKSVNLTQEPPCTGMPLTPYLPTACYACGRTWLAPATFELPSLCQSCHGPALVVPGESYRAEDVASFEKIESAISAQLPSEQVSHQLWVALSNVSERWRRPEDLVLVAIDAIPSLQFLIDASAEDRTQLARAIGMILAVLTTRLHSVAAPAESPGSEPSAGRQ